MGQNVSQWTISDYKFRFWLIWTKRFKILLQTILDVILIFNWTAHLRILPSLKLISRCFSPLQRKSMGKMCEFKSFIDRISTSQSQDSVYSFCLNQEVQLRTLQVQANKKRKRQIKKKNPFCSLSIFIWFNLSETCFRNVIWKKCTSYSTLFWWPFCYHPCINNSTIEKSENIFCKSYFYGKTLHNFN